MKILQLSNRLGYPLKDGGAIGIHNFTSAYHQLGHEVTVLAMNTKKHFVLPENLPAFYKNLAYIHTVYVDNSVKIMDAFLNLFSSQSYHVKRFVSKNYSDYLKKLLIQNKYDIVHLDGLFLSPYIDIIRKHSKAKIIMRAHNVEFRIWERMAYNGSTFYKKYYLKLLSKRLKRYELEQLNKYDLLVPISSEDAAVFINAGCKIPVKICAAGLNLDFYTIDKTFIEFPTVFYIGALDWMPNLEGLDWFLKNVWQDLSLKFPKLKMCIAGRNMPESIKKISLKNIVIIGEVEDAVSFINSKSIMLVPLLSGSGMRIKILEGMALAKPVVSTSIGAEGINYIDGNNILIANEPVEFVTQIEKLVNNFPYCEEIGKNARNLIADQYSNKKIVAELIKEYEKL